MPMNNSDLAYMAGIVDGEGSVNISYRRKKKYGDTQARVGLFVYNSDVRLLKWIQKRFHGSVHVYAARQPTWKPFGAWHASDLATMRVLELVLPFLVIKKDQAKIAIRFQKTKLPASLGRKNGVSISVAKLRRNLMVKLKKLNKRGT